MKGQKVHGVDNIDIKIAGPLVEEALPQLVNKSIEQRKFAKNWKPQLVKPPCVFNLVEVGKVAEYAIGEQIIEHIVENNFSIQTTMEDYTSPNCPTPNYQKSNYTNRLQPN